MHEFVQSDECEGRWVMTCDNYGCRRDRPCVECDLRAKLAEAEKRAEHEHAEMQRQAKLAVDWMIDAQKALAACAEMRAALWFYCSERQPHEYCRACSILSHTDLGRGWVGPEVVALLRRIIKYATEDRAVTPGSTRLARALDEGRALLGDEKGGVK